MFGRCFVCDCDLLIEKLKSCGSTHAQHVTGISGNIPQITIL